MVSKRSLFSWVFERFLGLQVLLFLMILAAIFFRVFPLEMQKRIINSAIALRKLDALLLYSGFFIGAVILAGILKYFINLLQGYIGQKILLEIRGRLYDHILTLPLTFYRRTPGGMVITSFTSELGVIGEFLGGAIAIPVINILTLLAFAAYLAYLNPLLALASFAIYPIEVVIIPILQKRFNHLNQHRIDVSREMSNVIGEAIAGMHEIHGNAGYGIEKSKFMRFADSLFIVRIRMNVYKFLIKFANNFFQSLGPFILFLLGGYLTINGRFDLGALVAFLSAYEKLYDPWKELMDYYQDLQDSRVRYQQIMDYFDVEPEFELAPPVDRPPYALSGQIEIRDMSYALDNQTHILDGISMDLKSGDQLAVVGLSGSGKSTLAMIVGQLYSYNGGHVLVDGKELKALTKVDVSRNIGYVAQHPFIFNGTIMENLLYAFQSIRLTNQNDGAPPVPERKEILRTLEEVGFAEDILKIGFDTILSPNDHGDFARRLIEMRELFFRRCGVELANEVDFLEEDSFQHYSSIGDNLTFGYPNSKYYEVEALPRNSLFREFLIETKMLKPLVALGVELATQTVVLLRDLREEAFFFEMSPIGFDEFEEYGEIVDRIAKVGHTRLPPRDEDAMLRLALRFVPARHKMAALSPDLEADLLKARRRFMEILTRRDPGAVTFYRPSEYLYSFNILTNILFGHPRTDHPQAIGLIRERVTELAREEGIIDDIMGLGLQFQVGSMGDRLSGGQKQKLAIARVLLKNPHILILDEATASLDNASQAHIMEVLGSRMRGRCTLIAVVHRLETVRDFDLIAVMRAGRIVESGRYDELMSKKGLFYELVQGT